MAAERYSPEDEQKEEKCFQLKLRKSERLVDWKKHFLAISRIKPVKYDSILISAFPQDKWELSIVIKKDVKGAYKRNRIKRIIREVYRTTKPFFSKPMAVLFTVKSNPKNLSYHELQAVIIENFCNNK
ncbi:MAG: ribonuclease P protein component [Candidatus Marinimicrobia bacterium]|nr:ribonuclease P protein component [Candidatus Neomarinimicrobiota bacterium]